MSEYLGWTERRPPAGSSSRFDRNELPGGTVTNSYEKYVKNIFHPSNRLKKDKDQMAADRGISASRMLAMERTFGRDALDDTLDEDQWTFVRTPLENLYSELGVKSSETNLYKQFPVYTPKQSSEYFAISNGYDPSKMEPYRSNSFSSSFRDNANEEYEKNNRKTLIDYKEFESSPLSPYLYQDHPYVRSQDSRIVGSNFVQVTSRPKDRFLEKIDATLAEVRSMPRYC